MKTTVIPTLKALSFYAPFLAGGAVLANQLSKIPFVSQNIESLEKIVVETFNSIPGVNENLANFSVNSSEFLLGALVALGAAHSIKKSRKKKDFLNIIEEKSQQEEKLRPFWEKAIISGGNFLKHSALATLAGLFLINSYKFVPQLYNFATEKFYQLTSRENKTLADIINDGVAIKTALSLAAIEVSSKLYSFYAHRKHPPICKRYYVNGYMAPTRAIHPKRLGVRRIAGTEPDSIRGMHFETVFCAKITSKDWRNGNKRKMLMAYRKDLEPREMKRAINVEGIENVLSYLKDYATKDKQVEEVTIAPAAVSELATNSKIYEAAKQGHFRKNNLDRFDLGRIIKVLSDVQEKNIFNVGLEHLVRKLNKEKLWDIGGYFQVSVYDDEKPLAVRVSLRESVLQSDAISKARKGGYGREYFKKGKMLMVFAYRTYEPGKVEYANWVEGAFTDAGVAEGIGSNIFREDKKGWNQLVKYGFGKSYLIFFGNRTCIYDEWWTGSGKIITDLIPGLRGKEYAIRRIGYVYDKRKIVAKISDAPWMIWSKPFGNYNSIVDVYEPLLADNENFGTLLCAFSRFLTHQRKYRENRLQEVLPDGTLLLTGTGDLDFVGQV